MVKKYQACVYKTKLPDGDIEWWVVTDPAPLAGIISYIEGEINEERFKKKGYHIIKGYNVIMSPAEDRLVAERTYSRIHKGRDAWSVDAYAIFEVYPELYEEVKKGKCEIYSW